MAENNYCASCGNKVKSFYCGHCGQKLLTDADRRLPALLGHAVGQILTWDGKLLVSLRALLLKPGELSAAWIAGQRVNYLKPITLFILINLVFFLMPPFTDFQLDINNQLYQPYGSLIEPMIQARAEARQITVAEYDAIYSERASAIAETLIFIHLPFLGLALLWLHRNRPIYYTEHLVVGTHLFSAYMLIALLLGVFFMGVAFILTRLSVSLEILQVIAVRGFNLLMLLYGFMALRRTYQLGRLRAVASILGFMIALVLVHLFIYRPVQFLVVFYST